MALVPTVTKTDYTGNAKVKSGYLTFDSSYPTGGEAITAAAFGLSQISSLAISPSGGYVFEYVPTQTPSTTSGNSLDGTVKAYWTGSTTSAVLAQVSNTTDLSALTTVPFVCRGL